MEKVLVPQSGNVSPSVNPRSDDASSSPSSSSSSTNAFDAMEEFNRQLEDIISLHGSAGKAASMMEAELDEENPPKTATQTDVSNVMQSLSKLLSPEEKLDELVKRHADLMSWRGCEEQTLLKLKEEQRSSIAARCKLETLCRKLHAHNNQLREEMLQRCREEEEKRSEITSHFQSTLQEIQAQIEQQNTRNNNLCRENTNLTEKLESLMNQCELREESMEKIDRHRDLQHKLTEAKLQQANVLLTEAEEKHKREKEYLLRETIDKTKKCCTMKEQELTMKKKLTLYAQKFDEFQATLAKSNDIYVHFKKEMEKMSEKMKTMEKESNQWKTRFENCNKTLTDMIVERQEKGREYDLFVLKIQKLERLCRALQQERISLYDKIKEVRLSNADIASKFLPKAGVLTSEECQELEEEDLVLTEDMSRLRAEQAKLQEFATSLLAEPFHKEEEAELDLHEDLVASAFAQFKTKTTISEDSAPVTESEVPEAVKVKYDSSPKASRSDESQKEQKPDKEKQDKPESLPTSDESQKDKKLDKEKQDKPESLPTSDESQKDQKLDKEKQDKPESLPTSDESQKDQKLDKEKQDKPESLSTSDESQKHQKLDKEKQDKPESLPTSDESQKHQKLDKEKQDKPESLSTSDESQKDKKLDKEKQDKPESLPTSDESNKPEIHDNSLVPGKPKVKVSQELTVKPNEAKILEEGRLDTPKVSTSASSPKDSPKTDASAETAKKQAPKKKKKRNGKNAS
ncbi:beta-taxilin isoform X3 [Gouania willdenowi]|uniref:beta-taxilin isoform X3 n=1 Tax=Gouania willdenowi TaxID=441366 RepID=UPI00105483C4|nr:beta-taxilin isoform X3 [Gouania willdenowi]